MLVPNTTTDNTMKKLTDFLDATAVCDYGFLKTEDGPNGLNYAISIVVPLSDAIVDEITDSPTFSYFHHYRTVNSYIDSVLLQTGIVLQQAGYKYMPVAASQSQPENGKRTHRGLYSHKKAAVIAGLGTVGRNSLFLHHTHGPRVRLGTVFTDFPLASSAHEIIAPDVCLDCGICVDACPANAITGRVWAPGIDRELMFDADACNRHMRTKYMHIGRGSVCGICISVCPAVR